jgi:hexosaminidase
VEAHNRIGRIDTEGAQTFRQLTAVFEKSRFPKGQSVGGRNFVHVLDDIKDHWADRTPGLEFMRAPELSIGLKAWLKDLADVEE